MHHQKRLLMNKTKIKIKDSVNICLFPLTILSYPCIAEDKKISSAYLHLMPDVNPDILQKLKEGEQAEGTYKVDIYVNKKQKISNKMVIFNHVDKKLTPQLTYLDLISLGIDPNFYNISEAENTSFFLHKYNIDFKFNFNTQKLYLSIPQRALSRKVKKTVDRQLWHDGNIALFSQYNYKGYYRLNKFTQNVRLNSGINIGAWRFRNHSNYYHSEKLNKFTVNSLYAYRQLNTLFSTLYLGQFLPTSRLLGSEKVEGVQFISSNHLVNSPLYANKAMLEGIADTQADIIVKQQGKIIYESNVPPGPFIIDTLPSMGSNELTLEIKEADGRIKTSIHYFTSMPNQLNKSSYQYNLIAGRVNDKHNHKEKPQYLLMGELAYGLNQQTTLYGAIKQNGHHHIYQTGLIFDLGIIGGLATDVSHIHNNNEYFKYQLRYRKRFSATNTNLLLNTSYNQFINNNTFKDGLKGQYGITVSQPLKKIGFLSIRYNQNFHSKNYPNFTVGSSFSSRFKTINYSINYRLAKNKKNYDNHFSLFFYIPLSSQRFGHHWLSHSANYYKDREVFSNNTHLGGSLLQDSRLHYSLSYTHDINHYKNIDNYSANIRYQGDYQNYNLQGDKNKNRDYNLQFGINGAVVLHRQGLTLAPYLGNSFAIVNTNGIADIKTKYSTKASTDRFGNLILPSLSLYQNNAITLDASSMPKNAHIDYYSQSVVPTLGAIMKINYPVRLGYNVLFESLSPIPFAATAVAYNDENKQISNSYTLQNNRLYLAGITEKGSVKIQWGNNSNQQCQFNYDISHQINQDSVTKKQIDCK